MTRKLVARKVTGCRSCFQPIQIGSDILWIPEFGAWHAECPTPEICPECNQRHSTRVKNCSELGDEPWDPNDVSLGEW